MSGYLVDAATLAGELATAGSAPAVLDVRWRLGGPPGLDSYHAGHIPGAVFIDLDHDLSAPPGPGGRHPLPGPAAFERSMRAAGVSEGQPVVVYDDGDGLPAARAWWTLRYFGHSPVRVLDGGYRAWTGAGLTASDAELAVLPGSFTARPGGMPLADAARAAALASSGVLIDVRAPERYRGETEPIDPVAGHIPGAVNVPITQTANADGTFKDPAALAAVFASAGVTPDDAPEVGAYCGSGVTAARGVLALAIAGIPAALYAGSWSEWITDPSRPVAP